MEIPTDVDKFCADMLNKRQEYAAGMDEPMPPRMIRRGGVLASCDSVDDIGEPTQQSAARAS